MTNWEKMFTRKLVSDGKFIKLEDTQIKVEIKKKKNGHAQHIKIQRSNMTDTFIESVLNYKWKQYNFHTNNKYEHSLRL